MRLLGFDLETTGLDTKKDIITEVGAAIWDTDEKRPLLTYANYCYNQGTTFSPETAEMMSRVCGIRVADLEEFGSPTKDHLECLEKMCSRHRVEYLVAHNGVNYDRPLLLAELDRHGLKAPCLRSLPLIDTRTDLPFDSRPDSLKLKHLAGDHGFLNPFAHRAIFDVLTMLKVLSHYSIEKIVENSKAPICVLRAVVPHPKTDNGAGKDAAKALGYSWQSANYKTYPNFWVKIAREGDIPMEKEAAAKCNAPFQVGVLEKINRC